MTRKSEPMSVGELLRRGLAGRPYDPAEREARQRQYDADRALAHAEAEKRMAALFQTHLERCGVPGRVARDAAAPALQPTKALAKAQEWLSGKAGHLLLSGNTGAGKSVAAAWTLRKAKRVAAWGLFDELEWDEAGALWLPFGALCRLSDYDEPGKALLRRAQRVPLLVLDDVGTGDAATLTPRERQRLEELADERDVPGRRTVWTTNLGLKPVGKSEFAAFIGPRVYSRLVRSVDAADCGGVDLRREGRS